MSLYVFSVEEYDTDRALLDEIRVLEFKIAGNSAPLRAFQVFFPNPVWGWVNSYRYIFSGMNIHLRAILGFTRYQGFYPSPYRFGFVHVPCHLPRSSGESCQCRKPRRPWIVLLTFFLNIPLIAMIHRIVNHYIPLLYDKIDIDSPLWTTINYDYYKPSVCSLKRRLLLPKKFPGQA